MDNEKEKSKLVDEQEEQVKTEEERKYLKRETR